MGGLLIKTRLTILLALTLVLLNYSYSNAQTVVPIASTDPVFLITEFKVSPSVEEFIEFTNNTNQELEISAVKLEYHSDSSPNYSNKTLTLKKTLPLAMPAGSKLQLSSATSAWVNDSLATFSAGLKDSVGWIKLSITVNNIIYSSYGHWGQKDEPECTTSPVPSLTQSLKRFVDSNSVYLLSTKPGEDYFLSSMPTPLDNLNPEPLNPDEIEDYCNKPIPPPPIEITPINTENPIPNNTTNTQPSVSTEQSPETPPTEVPTEIPKVYLPIQITEILPDPTSPQTDAEDEYIEIYNPNQESVELAGYKLESGSSFSYSYVFPNQNIAPGQYLVLYHKDTGLTLSNTASSVRILDPNGVILDETSYQNPKPAASWSKINGSWIYTNLQTPNLNNVYENTSPKTSLTTNKVSSNKPKTIKTIATKKPNTVKSSTKKIATTSAKKAKIPTTKTTKSSTNLNQNEPELTKLNSKYIYMAIVILSLYNLWEYRLSIKRFLMKPILKR